MSSYVNERFRIWFYHAMTQRITRSGGRKVNGKLIVIATLVLVAMLTTPAYGAMLKVSGKYVASLMYDGEAANPSDSVASINPGGTTRGIDLWRCLRFILL